MTREEPLDDSDYYTSAIWQSVSLNSFAGILFTCVPLTCRKGVQCVSITVICQFLNDLSRYEDLPRTSGYILFTLMCDLVSELCGQRSASERKPLSHTIYSEKVREL